jgi:hypothetical protein
LTLSTASNVAPRSRAQAWLLAALAGLLFFGLVTANSAGYRYGISDQAFYIPAIEADAKPGLFPRDSAVFGPQSTLTVSDELAATVARLTGQPLPRLFLAGYVLTVALFVAALWLIGGSLYHSAWTTIALGLALTFRHRIAKTGVNTFEGYFHPRMLAFALGLVAVGALLRRRRLVAWALALAAVAIHPTTGMWFAIWLAVADVAASPRVWRLAAILAGVAVLAGAWLVFMGPLAGRLAVMDHEWIAVFSDRDYLFPTDWKPGTWAVNAIAPLLVAGIYRWRKSLGLTSAAERGVVIGCGVLIGVFLASLPFIAARIALAVQLQTSRVLWQADVLATIYLVWAFVEAPWPRLQVSAALRQRGVVALLAIASLARGGYILRVEHANALVAVGLPSTDWQRTAEWARQQTPIDAHFLVDPEHTWRYGVSFRIAASRDVYLERAKDAAIAIYSRDVAMQVTARNRDLGDFNSLSAEQMSALARTYDLDYVISERPLALPEVVRHGALRVYALAAR